jgi:outer membrane protein OmpA-like peptidoglycan-associated protein
MLVLSCGLALIASACATKGFVQEQLSTTETRLTQLMNATETLLSARADTQETSLRETADRTRASRQAIDEVAQQTTVVASNARDAEARLSQRLADRNKFRLLGTSLVYFDSGHADIRSDAMKELDDIAATLKTDANAIVELQGFADPRGSDRYNNDLARDRVEAVTRYLVLRHDVELRQIRAVAMGKEALGQKADAETLARARRVDVRLLAPWSSWEDRQASDDAGLASPRTSVDAERGATPTAAPRDVLGQDAPGPWADIVKTISPRDLGARD